MIQETFIDNVVRIGIAGGIVRLDLGTISASEPDDQGNVKLEARQRLLMTPQGFLNMFSSMETMMQKLVELKVIERKQTQADSVVVEGGKPSPNFS